MALYQSSCQTHLRTDQVLNMMQVKLTYQVLTNFETNLMVQIMQNLVICNQCFTHTQPLFAQILRSISIYSVMGECFIKEFPELDMLRKQPV